MAAAVVYEGVPGRFEGTLFNGVKFWVAQRVPFRGTLIDKITNNGGKIVLLEKHAHVLIDDDAKKFALPAPGAVSWKYIDESVKKGELVNIEDYRINRPAQAALPARGIKVPYTKDDEQILVTWIRQCEEAGEYIQGNLIYQKLAKLYPQHTWHSWRDKWIKKMSLLPENSLPAVLPHLPPPRGAPAAAPPSTGNQTPAATAHPSSLRPAMTPPPAARPSSGISGMSTSPKKRTFFAEEDDKLLTQYVMELMEAGIKVNGNKHYKSLAEQHPHHSWHSWRDRWVRHLSQRSLNALGEPELVPREPQLNRVEAVVSSQSLPQEPSTEQRLPPNTRENRHNGLDVRLKTSPARPPSIPRPPPTQAKPPLPPPSTAAAQNTRPAVTATETSRLQALQDLSRRKKEIQKAREKAATKIQRFWREYRARRNVRRDFPAIAAFQARARGYLARVYVGFAEVKHEPSEAAWSPADEPALPEHGSPVLGSSQGSAAPRPPAGGRVAAAAGAGACAGAGAGGDDGESDVHEEKEDDDDEEGSVGLTSEEFWKLFNGFNELRAIAPVPWVQIGPRSVELWDLWRHASEQPHHATRDWEVVAEDLGFDWIAEPDAPARVKAAFEAHLLEFETALREFFPSTEAQGAPGDGDEEEFLEEEGADEEASEGQELDEGASKGEAGAEDEVEDEDGDANLSDAGFVSSPPLIGLKRPMGSSASPFLGSFSKRPRYDPSSEIPCTPETRRQRGEHEMVAAAAAAIRETPTWRSRVMQLAGHSKEHEPARLSHAQEDEADDDDDEVLTPSQQLQSEVDAASPIRLATRSSREPALPANRAMPTVEELDDDREVTDSSDAFESVSKLKLSRPNPRDMARPRRTLPWANTGSKQPATAPKPLHTATAKTLSQPRPPPPIPTTTPTIDFNTNPFAYLLAHRAAYEADPHNPSTPRRHHTDSEFLGIASVALRATSFEQARAERLLRRMLAGSGELPANERGVWTGGDDARLRRVGQWVAGFAGSGPGGPGGRAGGGLQGQWLPRREDRAAFGGDDAARGVFWALVEKHGRLGVLERWGFLERLGMV